MSSIDKSMLAFESLSKGAHFTRISQIYIKPLHENFDVLVMWFTDAPSRLEKKFWKRIAPNKK